MKKMLAVIFVCFLASVCSCGSERAGNQNLSFSQTEDISSNSTIPKPKLHIVEQDDVKYLEDDQGEIWYSLGQPYITVDVNRNVFVVNPHVYYSPGTSYYGKFYDGFNVTCGCHPRAGCDPLKMDFGPEGGELSIPASPLGICQFNAFVIDGEGTLFKTDLYLVFSK